MEGSGLWILDGNKFPDTRSVEIKSVPHSYNPLPTQYSALDTQYCQLCPLPFTHSLRLAPCAMRFAIFRLR